MFPIGHGKRNPACPSDKQLSNFACTGQLFPLVEPRPLFLPIRQMRMKTNLSNKIQQSTCLNKWTVLFSSPDSDPFEPHSTKLCRKLILNLPYTCIGKSPCHSRVFICWREIQLFLQCERSYSNIRTLLENKGQQCFSKINQYQ